MATELTPGYAAELHIVLKTAATQLGLDATGAELIRYTVNAVYRLPATRVIARIGIGTPGLFRAPRLVHIARWLAERDAPIVQLIDGPQPVIVDDKYAVTFWHELSTETIWTAEDLAAPLRELHQLTPAPTLPHWDPFGHARRRLAAADPALPANDLEWLHTQWATVEHQYNDYRSLMPTGIVHADPHIGNLLRDNLGRVVLCDLDGTGIGPLAWDLVPQAVGARRFARAQFYHDFVVAYGTDVTIEPYWPVLSRIRELIAVTSVVPQLATRPDIAAEHAHRLRTLREDRPDVTWHLYQ
ncbi:phosphotransferase [Nocardia amamiensis]|uniref:phosphotransferase n=1 Tax=Nocardia amamiensis TaxID=404578 RepID=UPI003406DDAD